MFTTNFMGIHEPETFHHGDASDDDLDEIIKAIQERRARAESQSGQNADEAGFQVDSRANAWSATDREDNSSNPVDFLSTLDPEDVWVYRYDSHSREKGLNLHTYDVLLPVDDTNFSGAVRDDNIACNHYSFARQYDERVARAFALCAGNTTITTGHVREVLKVLTNILSMNGDVEAPKLPEEHFRSVLRLLTAVFVAVDWRMPN